MNFKGLKDIKDLEGITDTASVSKALAHLLHGTVMAITRSDLGMAPPVTASEWLEVGKERFSPEFVDGILEKFVKDGYLLNENNLLKIGPKYDEVFASVIRDHLELLEALFGGEPGSN